MSPQENTESHLPDALPLIYRAELDGTIVYLEGGFDEALQRLNTTRASFLRVQELFEELGVHRPTIDTVIEDLLSCRANSINTKVTIDIQGNRRRHLWIGSLSKDLQFLQGQFVDIEEAEQLQDQFDRLRELTYGTKYLGERIATGKEKARIRRISVLFVDTVDSTRRIFAMEVDKAREYVENIAGIITSAVKKHNGYLDKFMGDGAMITWGYQIAPGLSTNHHEADSVLAAREMLRTLRDFNRGKPEVEEIHFRIGIASGDMFSGAFKNDDRMIFTAIGKAIHIAARLEKATEPDSIFVEHAHLLEVQKTRPEIVGHSHCTLLEAKGIPGRVRACKIDPD